MLLGHGFRDEANSWGRWLLRAVAGEPGDVFGEVKPSNSRPNSASPEAIFHGHRSAPVWAVWKRTDVALDSGIWEIRGAQRDFISSRAMIWAAFDCAVRAVIEFGLDGPLALWIKLRSEIESRGFDHSRS